MNKTEKTEKTERICGLVDSAIAPNRVSGGYLSGDHMICYSTGATVITAVMLATLGMSLKAPVKLHKQGVRVDFDDIIEGECWPVVKVETVDVMELIGMHESKMKRRILKR